MITRLLSNFYSQENKAPTPPRSPNRAASPTLQERLARIKQGQSLLQAINMTDELSQNQSVECIL